MTTKPRLVIPGSSSGMTAAEWTELATITQADVARAGESGSSLIKRFLSATSIRVLRRFRRQ